MSISDIDIGQENLKRKRRKIVLIYLILSAATVAVDHIYAIFGHGVRSAAMTWMFLYPLIGGALFYGVAFYAIFRGGKAERNRLIYNLYNSGIAAFTVGSFLKGILDIAGTSSPYTKLFFITGVILVLAGLIKFCLIKITER